MALSQAFLQAMIEQIRPLVLGNYLNRVTRFAPGSYAFNLSRSKGQKLVIALDNDTPYLTVTDSELAGSGQTSAFFQVLKKELNNALVTSLTIEPTDRIVYLGLDVVTPAYERRQYRLVIELIPMMANLFLIDENNQIIAIHKPSKSLDVARPLVVKMIYTPPVRVQATSPFSREERHILTEQQRDPDNEKRGLFINEGAIYSSFAFFADHRSQELTPHSFFLRQVDHAQARREGELFKDVFDLTTRKIKQLSHKIKRITTELAGAERNAQLSVIANLLLTHQDEIPPRAELVRLEEQDIVLDPHKTVFANANAYFKKAKKAKTALIEIARQISETTAELDYFIGINQAIKIASEDELKEIKTELGLNGYLENINHKVIAPRAVFPYQIEVASVKIGFGHNNLQNDYLTFTLAHPRDYFLHVAQHPGAHVVIFSADPPAEVIQVAAEIALFSAGLPSGEVLIADCRYVKKGDRPGRVHLLKFATMNITKISPTTEKYYLSATRLTAKH